MPNTPTRMPIETLKSDKSQEFSSEKHFPQTFKFQLSHQEITRNSSPNQPI